MALLLIVILGYVEDNQFLKSLLFTIRQIRHCINCDFSQLYNFQILFNLKCN